MKALRLHAAGDLRLDEEREPVVQTGEELVRVTAVGLCGSDRHWFIEGGIGDATLARPLILGHEIVGVVEEGHRHGLRVVVDPADPCERCQVCLAGNTNLCPDIRFAGHGETDGGLRPLMAWPRRLLHALPDSISDAEAALLEPLGVALHAAAIARVQPGISAGVYGCGPIGLLLVQLLHAMGCSPIVATDLLPHRLDAATQLGATHAVKVDAETADLPDVDAAFEVAGEDTAVADAVRSVRPGGLVVLIGIPSADRTSFPASAARRKGLSLVLCRRMVGRDLARGIKLVGDRRVDLRALVSESFPLADADAAFAALVERRGLKVLIEPNKSVG